MESTRTQVKEWTEPDGTKVIETITTKRITPSRGNSGAVVFQQQQQQEINNESKNKTNNDGYVGGSFEQQALDRHNMYRAKHGCPKLTLDKQLCSYAQEWANNLARLNRMEHRSNNKYGENIFYKGGTHVSINGNEAVDAWYNEIKDYNFNSPGFRSGTGHFTQVVWKDSKRLGIAYAQSGQNIYVVANYDPPGNYQGRFQENVPRPI